MNPPCLQIIAWSTWDGSSHTHTDGKSLISQLYYKWMASQNSHLFRVNCISFSRMTVSQLEASFSAASPAALLVLSGRVLFTSFNFFCRHSSLSLHALVIVVITVIVIIIIIIIIIIVITSRYRYF